MPTKYIRLPELEKLPKPALDYSWDDIEELRRRAILTTSVVHDHKSSDELAALCHGLIATHLAVTATNQAVTDQRAMQWWTQSVELEEKLVKLQLEYDKLQLEYDKVKEEHEVLAAQHSKARDEHDDLRLLYNEVAAANIVLNNERYVLNLQHCKVEDDRTVLAAQHCKVEVELANMISSYNGVTNDLDALGVKCDGLQKVCNDLVGENDALLAEKRTMLARGASQIFGDPQYHSLSGYLDQPHARNNTGKRNVGDLTYDEIRSLDRGDLCTVALALHGVTKMQALESARYKRDYYLAKSHEFSALHHEAERDLKLADMENRGTRTDTQP